MKSMTRVFGSRQNEASTRCAFRRLMAGGAIAAMLGLTSTAAASDARNEFLRVLDGMDETAGRIAPIAGVRAPVPVPESAKLPDEAASHTATDNDARPRVDGALEHRVSQSLGSEEGGPAPAAAIADAGVTARHDSARGVTARSSVKLAKSESAEKSTGTPMTSLSDRDVEKTANGGWLPVGMALLALAGVAFWLKRRATGSAGRRGLEIETLGTTRVLGKHAVSLVKIGGRVLVVGHGDKGLTLLTELDEGEIPSFNRDKQAGDELLPIGGAAPVPARVYAKKNGMDGSSVLGLSRSADSRTGGVETGAGSFIERVSRMRAGWKAEGGRSAHHLEDDPFHAALMEEAPIDELQRLDDRAQIRERLEKLRRRSAVAVA